IQLLLPAIFQRVALPGSPLAALLAVMEDLHAPDEAVLASLDSVFDPRRAPDRFVPLLARWLDLDRLLERPGGGATSWDTAMTSGLRRLRELLANAAYLSKWRGTDKGLRLFLEVATGARGFDIDEEVAGDDGRPVAFHVRVVAPPEAAPHAALITRIIEM